MSSTIIKTVAIAGASGALGTPVTKALLDAGFTVTALTRQDSKSSFPSGVKVVHVDYTSKSTLESALQGQDALISTLSTQSIDQQKLLLEAAVSVGVYRILPSEFGSDTSNPKARALPCYSTKVDVEEYVKQLVEKSNGKTTYTLVLNNAFLDWGIAYRFLIDPVDKKYELIDGGNNYFTTTPLSFVAKGVAAILQRPEATANRAIHLQGTRLTQRQLLAMLQKITGGAESWTVTEANSKDIERDAFETLKTTPENLPAWLFPMLKLAVYAEGFGGDFAEQGDKDNEMLGLKQLKESEVEEIIRAEVAKLRA